MDLSAEGANPSAGLAACLSKKSEKCDVSLSANVHILTLIRLQNSRFRTFSVRAILACEAREPHTPVGLVHIRI